MEAVDLHDVLITSCQSEEADQRLIRHTLHCVSEKYKKIVVRTVDTDVLALLLSYVSQVHDSSSNTVIYAHMVNSNQEYYNITAAVDLLGTDTCKALPFLYAFSGCDIVSSCFFYG